MPRTRKDRIRRKRLKKLAFFLCISLVICLGCIGVWQLKSHSKDEAKVEKNVTKAKKTTTATKKVKETPKKKEEEKVEKTENTRFKKVICIDPGHQRSGNNSLEPIGPGASTKKPKVASGTKGRYTGVYEYELTLNIALKLRTELEKRGYKVYLTRETNDVDISIVERAKYANESGASVCIRLHADGLENSNASGASVLYPGTTNPYVSNLSELSKELSSCIISEYCSQTGLSNRGTVVRNDLTGTNWSKIPVALIEMGFMTNHSDDINMQNPAFQAKMVSGIANGIDKFFVIK
jgi:N-acetylmuramoyl-L-alanine amidase